MASGTFCLTVSNARASVRVTSRLWPARDDALGNGGNLVGSLAWAEDDLGKTLPEAAVMVDPGEAQVLERRLAQKLKKPVVRLLRCKALRLNVVQEARGGRRGS